LQSALEKLVATAVTVRHINRMNVNDINARLAVGDADLERFFRMSWV